MARPAATLDVFHAVADPTRRRILDLLAAGEQAVMDLVSCFRISQPAISQHLRVLRDVGLVRTRQEGRHRMYSLNPEQLRIVAEWVAHYERFWDQRFANLSRYLDRTRPATSHESRAPTEPSS
jgi:DNA-binding transcriptional ArsR family regulator